MAYCGLNNNMFPKSLERQDKTQKTSMNKVKKTFSFFSFLSMPVEGR